MIEELEQQLKNIQAAYNLGLLTGHKLARKAEEEDCPEWLRDYQPKCRECGEEPVEKDGDKCSYCQRQDG